MDKIDCSVERKLEVIDKQFITTQDIRVLLNGSSTYKAYTVKQKAIKEYTKSDNKGNLIYNGLYTNNREIPVEIIIKHLKIDVNALEHAVIRNEKLRAIRNSAKNVST